MTDTKTYSSKSNAIRAFRTKYRQYAEGVTNDAIVDLGLVDEDEPGKWVINDPNAADENEAAEQARADAEHAERQRVAAEAEQARKDADAALEAGAHPMLSGKAPAPQAVQVHNTALDKAGTADGKCPHCGASTRNGKNVTNYAEMSPGSQNTTTQQFTCNDCAGEWGPVVDKPKKARAPSGTSDGLKIEKDRQTSNGVTRPSIGGKCRGIWDMLDAMYSITGKWPTAAEARKDGEHRFDKTTIMVQFYRWRKFNGIEGRQA